MARRGKRRRGGGGIANLGQLLALMLLVVIAWYGYQDYETHYAPQATGSTACDESLWAHVYHPDRLQDPDPAQHHHCMRVTGTVTAVRTEDDGDVHVRIHLDGNQSALLNAKNVSDQHGDLVVEPVCAKAVTQADAVQACQGYANRVTLPGVGDHVAVVGVYVLDTEHGWMELHPVTSITRI